MTLSKLLSDDIFKLPLVKGEGEVLIEILTQKFDRYIELLRDLDNTDQYTDAILKEMPQIELLCNGIKETVELYLKGSPYKAYSIFNEGISKLDSHIYESRMDIDVYLYRIRDTEERHLTKKDIFHIPFESRGRVENQRFSINGFPCLYFGSSIYACWEELNRPGFDNLHISAFKSVKSPHVLDLTFPVGKVGRRSINFKPKDSDIVNKIILFPLIISCSVKNKNNTDIFKEEYIVPQILLEWLNNTSKIDAIKYSSLSLPNYNLDDSLFINYVFPAKNHSKSGHCCYLRDMFMLTDPISWNFAKSIYVNNRSISPRERIHNFKIVDPIGSYYPHTGFGHMEQIIKSMNFSKLEAI